MTTTASDVRMTHDRNLQLHEEAKEYLIPTQAKRNLSSRSGIGGVLSAT